MLDSPSFKQWFWGNSKLPVHPESVVRARERGRPVSRSLQHNRTSHVHESFRVESLDISKRECFGIEWCSHADLKTRAQLSGRPVRLTSGGGVLEQTVEGRGERQGHLRQHFCTGSKGQSAETVSVNGKHVSIPGTVPSVLAKITHLTLVRIL